MWCCWSFNALSYCEISILSAYVYDRPRFMAEVITAAEEMAFFTHLVPALNGSRRLFAQQSETLFH